MNIGYENDELKPYLEPIPDLNDKSRLGIVNILMFYPPISLNNICKFFELFLYCHGKVNSSQTND